MPDSADDVGLCRSAREDVVLNGTSKPETPAHDAPAQDSVANAGERTATRC